MKLKTVLLGLTAAAVSTGVAFAQMQPIPNPPEKPKAAAPAKHHAKKHSTKKKSAPKASAAAGAAKSGGDTATAPAGGAK
jgi:hypothetical protein